MVVSFDVNVDLDLVATLDVQRILVSMATTPSSKSMPLRDKFSEFEHVERGGGLHRLLAEKRQLALAG